MTALTMEQRRQDFESMLKRANRIVRAGRFAPPAPPEPPERLLTALASDVTNLAAVWAECVQAVRDGEHPTRVSTRAAMKALTVAARCLQALSERDPDGYLEPIRKMADYKLHGRDLGMDPAERIGWFLSTLGDLASCYHQGYDPSGEIIVYRLRDLTIEVICAAVAAERGLWQEEES